MRAFWATSTVLSIALVFAGGWLALNADLLVARAEVRRMGERLHWPGMYATTTRGCFFRPDWERWQTRMRLLGGGAALLGATAAYRGGRALRLTVSGKQAA